MHTRQAMFSSAVLITMLMSGTTMTASARPAANSSGSSGAVPESMQIQEQTNRENNQTNTNATSTTATPTTEAPTNKTTSPVESNRIDTSAPPSERLQIDDGAAAAVRGTGTANGAAPNNTIVRGAPSTAGTGSNSATSTGAGASTSSSTGASTGVSGASGTSSTGGTAGSSSAGSGAAGGGGGH